MILLDAEDMWAKSAQYKYMPLDTPTEEYRIQRDIFKAERIYSLYGYEYCVRFIKQCPHILPYMDDYVPCIKEPYAYQCTMFCHKYDFEKGCLKYANE